MIMTSRECGRKAERAFSSLSLSLRRYLEELHSDAGEHKLQQRGDDDDVADGADGHKHALNHVLEGGRRGRWVH